MNPGNESSLRLASEPHAEQPVDVRIRMSALWVATLFVFAYVDLFSLYRSDVRADLDGGKLFVFDVTQTFLFSVTLYIVIPSLMVYLSLVLPRKINRIANIAVAAIYAITIFGSAIGEWTYFVFGSVVESILLLILVRTAWTWRPLAPAGNVTASAERQSSEAMNSAIQAFTA